MIASMMDIKAKARLFVSDTLKSTAEINVTAYQAHYLLRVLRAKKDDHIILFNGYDGEWASVIKKVTKKNCRLRVKKQLRKQHIESDLWLAFAPLKKTKTDFVIEKASELGVSRLIPVFTENTNTSRVNAERLRIIAIDSAEQCDRLTVADVTEPMTFAELLNQWPNQRHLLVPDETGGGKPIKLVLENMQLSPQGILIGPEGGFARSELDALKTLSFVTLVSLGQRILRAETAAIATLACYQAAYGDWNKKPRFNDGYTFNARK